MPRLLPFVLAMAALVAASNVLVQFLAGPWLTWGAFTYPFAFLVTDLANRLHGPAAARRVVLAGFAAGLVCSAVAAGLGLTTLRIALGSAAAFLSAQLLDVALFDRLRQGRWWTAPLASSLVASAVDTALFFSIAFSARLSFLDPAADVDWAGALLPLLGVGPVVPLWVSLAAADFGVKVLLAFAALVPFRLVVSRLGARIA